MGIEISGIIADEPIEKNDKLYFSIGQLDEKSRKLIDFKKCVFNNTNKMKFEKGQLIILKGLIEELNDKNNKQHLIIKAYEIEFKNIYEEKDDSLNQLYEKYLETDKKYKKLNAELRNNPNYKLYELEFKNLDEIKDNLVNKLYDFKDEMNLEQKVMLFDELHLRQLNVMSDISLLIDRDLLDLDKKNKDYIKLKSELKHVENKINNLGEETKLAHDKFIKDNYKIYQILDNIDSNKFELSALDKLTPEEKTKLKAHLSDSDKHKVIKVFLDVGEEKDKNKSQLKGNNLDKQIGQLKQKSANMKL